jgi:hypothetical protein
MTVVCNTFTGSSVVGMAATGDLVTLTSSSAIFWLRRMRRNGVAWAPVDSASDYATMTDSPLTLTLLLRFGLDGLVAGNRTYARTATVDGVSVMLPWECRMSGYRLQEGMIIPMTSEFL